ncbi:hypothetical protein SAMN05661093_04503 [Kibdelosporangium aridum]|uniref:Uncharacterized protein n=1 Tax=Kibdelosporangium aridum TaxID=2030 RepID=A0A1Y5XPL2_KIBAR|nr:hypothetical protein SAMN05661093_04503 [Kibdelosporangium aridum]
MARPDDHGTARPARDRATSVPFGLHLWDRDTSTAAGFQDIEWQDPETSGFYQPVVTARGATP